MTLVQALRQRPSVSEGDPHSYNHTKDAIQEWTLCQHYMMALAQCH